MEPPNLLLPVTPSQLNIVVQPDLFQRLSHKACLCSPSQECSPLVAGILLFNPPTEEPTGGTSEMARLGSAIECEFLTLYNLLKEDCALCLSQKNCQVRSWTYAYLYCQQLSMS